MSRLDLVIKSGTLVTPRAMYAADIGVLNEKVVAVCAPGELDATAAETILDASGRYVLPGVIDGHVHFREPGLEHKEDFGTGSTSAVMGGVTTVLDMPNTLPTTRTGELAEQKRRLVEPKAYCDFGLYGLLVQESVAELRAMAAAGVVGFKCFMGQSIGNIPPPDDGKLLEALQIIADLGLRCGFHAENDELMQHRIQSLQTAGRTDPLAHLESRPVLAEVESIQRVALFASHTGARIHIFHLSSAPGLAMVEAWRRQGVDITCETAAHYCFFTSEDMRRLGPMLRINPPVREPGHSEALLRALASGGITAIATDHSPHLLSEKLHEDIWQAVSGFAGVEISLRLFLTLGVHAGRLTLPQLARATSEGPARAWGLFPRKGAIQVGSDADFAIVDLDVEDTVAAARLHGKNNQTPFEGQKTRGAAVATVLRGHVVMRQGELLGPPRGRMVTPIVTPR